MEPEKLYKYIWGQLEASMHALDHGGEVNMVELDKNVRYFCDIVTKLPPLEAKKYDEKIHNIVQYLTDIVNRLTERKAEIGEQINQATNRRKAQSAYGVAISHSSPEAK